MTIPLDWLVLLTLGMLAYLPAFNGPFIFDDRDSVLHNPAVMAGNWRHLIRAAMFRHITLITFAWQCLWPKTSRSFRIVNVLIHAAIAILVQSLLVSQGIDPLTAQYAAILYAVHPFAANTVAYITGRASLLSTGFAALGIVAILAGQPLLAIPCIVGAVLSKEDGTAFVVAFAMVAAYQGSLGWWLWLAAGAVFLCWKWRHLREILALSGDLEMTRGGLPGSHPQPQHGWTVLVETILRYPCWILGLKQAPYHGSGIPVPSVKRSIAAGSILTAALMAFFTIPDLRLPLILIAIGPWLVYVVCRVPDPLIEYRNYSSLLGIIWVIAILCESAPLWVWWLMIAYAAANTAWQAKAWSSGKEMWNAVIRRGAGEKSRAWQELAVEYKEDNDWPAAEACFRKALAINPRLAPARRNLAWMYVQQNRLADGLKELEFCVEHCPEHAFAWEEYGYALEMAHRPGEAEEAYRKALALKPRFPTINNHLGKLLFARQDYKAAQACFALARKREPSNTAYTWNWAWATRYLGDRDAAKAALATLGQQIPMNSEMVMPPEAQYKMAMSS